jgi:type VI secretion system protein ImpK
MNLIATERPTAMAVDIDSLLQDSYLLVVELHQGASAQDTDKLITLCVQQVEQVRRLLKEAGLSQRSIDHISHAQCALLDETVLTCAKDDAHAKWAAEPLQARFFNRHQAGEFLFDDMREVLREPAPDIHVLTAFQRILVLGFQGRFRDMDDPERERLLAALNEQVAPLKPGRTFATQMSADQRMSEFLWSHSPLLNALAVGLLLAGVWFGLDLFLSGRVAAFLPGEF